MRCPKKMVCLYQRTGMSWETHAGDSTVSTGSQAAGVGPILEEGWGDMQRPQPWSFVKKPSHTCLNTASFQQRGKGVQTAQLCYCNHKAQAKLDRAALFSWIWFYKLHSSGAALRCYAEVSGIVSITNKSLCPKFMLDRNLASIAQT